jgi:hypothetical protein
MDMRKAFGPYITNSDCVICKGALDFDKNCWGIVEFTDGWYWICSSCRNAVGIYDHTKHSSRDNVETIPYERRSRKRWWAWLFDREYPDVTKVKEHTNGPTN